MKETEQKLEESSVLSEGGKILAGLDPSGDQEEALSSAEEIKRNIEERQEAAAKDAKAKAKAKARAAKKKAAKKKLKPNFVSWSANTARIIMPNSVKKQLGLERPNRYNYTVKKTGPGRVSVTFDMNDPRPIPGLPKVYQRKPRKE